LPLTALLLVIAAAFTHSIWNLLAKRVASHTHFIWFTSIGESVLLLPLVVSAALTGWAQFDWRAAVCLVSSGALELAYAQSLMRGYRLADLSIVYPVARGMGSLLAYLGAIIILRETRSFSVVAGPFL
jgi:multidrug transporter EmrE-like cation transporter